MRAAIDFAPEASRAQAEELTETILQKASSTGREKELQQMQYENERLRQNLAILTSRKSEIESNLVHLTDRLEKLETTNATLDVAAAPREVLAASGPAAPGKAREAAVAQLEEECTLENEQLSEMLCQVRAISANFGELLPQITDECTKESEQFSEMLCQVRAISTNLQELRNHGALMKERADENISEFFSEIDDLDERISELHLIVPQIRGDQEAKYLSKTSEEERMDTALKEAQQITDEHNLNVEAQKEGKDIATNNVCHLKNGKTVTKKTGIRRLRFGETEAMIAADDSIAAARKEKRMRLEEHMADEIGEMMRAAAEKVLRDAFQAMPELAKRSDMDALKEATMGYVDEKIAMLYSNLATKGYVDEKTSALYSNLSQIKLTAESALTELHRQKAAAEDQLSARALDGLSPAAAATSRTAEPQLFATEPFWPKGPEAADAMRQTYGQPVTPTDKSSLHDKYGLYLERTSGAITGAPTAMETPRNKSEDAQKEINKFNSSIDRGLSSSTPSSSHNISSSDPSSSLKLRPGLPNSARSFADISSSSLLASSCGDISSSQKPSPKPALDLGGISSGLKLRSTSDRYTSTSFFRLDSSLDRRSSSPPPSPRSESSLRDISSSLQSSPRASPRPTTRLDSSPDRLGSRPKPTPSGSVQLGEGSSPKLSPRPDSAIPGTSSASGMSPRLDSSRGGKPKLIDLFESPNGLGSLGSKPKLSVRLDSSHDRLTSSLQSTPRPDDSLERRSRREKLDSSLERLGSMSRPPPSSSLQLGMVSSSNLSPRPESRFPSTSSAPGMSSRLDSSRGSKPNIIDMFENNFGIPSSSPKPEPSGSFQLDVRGRTALSETVSSGVSSSTPSGRPKLSEAVLSSAPSGRPTLSETVPSAVPSGVPSNAPRGLQLGMDSRPKLSEILKERLAKVTPRQMRNSI